MTHVILDEVPLIEILSFEIDESDVVWYNISVSVGDRSWRVTHRYSEFDSLQSSLKTDKKLPPKKLRPSNEFLEHTTK